MFICFICNNSLKNSDLLIEHLKVTHNVPVTYSFRCKQLNCFQIFQNINKFKNHLKIHERKLKQFEEKVCNDNQVFREISETFQQNSFHNNTVNKNVSPSNKNCQSLENSNELCKNQECDVYLENNPLLFSLEIHSQKNTTKKNVIQIQNLVTTLITSPIHQFLITNVLPYVNNAECHLNLLRFLENINDPFKDIRTEYKFFKYLEEKDLYKPPKKFTINNELLEVISHGTPLIQPNKVEGCLSNLTFQTKKYFQSDNVFKEVVKHMKKFENSTPIEHFLNGEVWKRRKTHFQNKIVIPYFLYFDDFEVNDPLSSHAGVHSVCGIYFNFPTLEKFQLSKLHNIFVAGFIKTSDFRDYDQSSTLKLLAEEIITLEENGIVLNIDKKDVTVYFVLGLILGDNLG